MKNLFILLTVFYFVSCNDNECETKVKDLEYCLDTMTNRANILHSDNIFLMIDIGRYEIIMNRLLEQDSIMYEQVTSNLE
jgi:hypothetical protein